MRPDVLWSGGAVTDRATCILAPNPGPMTLDGTNTWILAEPSASEAVVVDPGPDDQAHLDRILAHCAAQDLRVSVILLTHGHLDHSEGVSVLQRRTRASVRAWHPADADALHPGERLQVAGLDIEVLATPGHSSDSVTFHLPGDRALLTGDTVLGRGTTVVAWPDGHLADYLGSLELLRDAAGQVDQLLPGHGPVLPDPAQVLTSYVEHRRARLEQVRQAVSQGATTAEAVVDAVYGDLAADLRAAALLSTRAQLEYLGAF